MSDFGHGAVGTREQAFTTLLPLRTAPQKTELLVALAASIQAVVDEVKDGADGEENLWMPAGYTYFGQFIDRDENSIISQIQLSFIKFHNAVVAQIKKKQPEVKGTALFNQARNQVRWAYQKLVIEDFLPRIVRADVLKGLNDKTSLDRHYALYDTPEKRSNLPREFVGAAYRFGHSGVRFGYRLNTTTRLSIFVSSNHPERDSLLGFDPLP